MKKIDLTKGKVINVLTVLALPIMAKGKKSYSLTTKSCSRKL